MANPSLDIEPPREGRPQQMRAPLLWVLLPLIGGYTLAKTLSFTVVCPFLLTACLCSVIAWWTADSTGNRRHLWALCFPLAVLCMGWAWWLVRVPPAPPEWDVLPPREVDLQLQVVQTFRNDPSGRYWRGVARIEEAPWLASELRGKLVIFSTRSDDSASGFFPGVRLQVRGVLARIDPTHSDFDRSWEERQVFFRLRQGRILEVSRAPPFWREWAGHQKARWAAILTQSKAGQEKRAGILGAMLLGDRSLLDLEQREGFILSGTMHLFAVSGLHVIAVAAALQGLLLLVPLPRRIKGVCTLGLLGIYVLVIGLPPSATRAYLMLVFYATAKSLNRKANPFPAVIASAVCILLWDPRQLLSLGFQLSYTVVCSILLIGLPLAERTEHWLRQRERMRVDQPGSWERFYQSTRRKTIQALGISIAATFGSTPLIIGQFEVFTPGAIILNPLLIPIASVVVANGILVLLLGLAGLESISFFFSHGAWILVMLMEWMVEKALALPGLFFHRVWQAPVLSSALTACFLALSLGTHEVSLKRRWPTSARHLIPLLMVLLAVITVSTSPPK